MVQNGREVYKWASRTLPVGIKELLRQAELPMDEISWFVPHSANLRMIESICEKNRISRSIKTLTSVEYMGNTSSVSIPLALQIGINEGKLKKWGHSFCFMALEAVLHMLDISLNGI
ncbi:hypothetical protein GCM10020331_029320 [Ectobacillus funiculus]